MSQADSDSASHHPNDLPPLLCQAIRNLETQTEKKIATEKERWSQERTGLESTIIDHATAKENTARLLEETVRNSRSKMRSLEESLKEINEKNQHRSGEIQALRAQVNDKIRQLETAERDGTKEKENHEEALQRAQERRKPIDNFKKAMRAFDGVHDTLWTARCHKKPRSAFDTIDRNLSEANDSLAEGWGRPMRSESNLKRMKIQNGADIAMMNTILAIDENVKLILQDPSKGPFTLHGPEHHDVVNISSKTSSTDDEQLEVLSPSMVGTDRPDPPPAWTENGRPNPLEGERDLQQKRRDRMRAVAHIQKADDIAKRHVVNKAAGLGSGLADTKEMRRESTRSVLLFGAFSDHTPIINMGRHSSVPLVLLTPLPGRHVVSTYMDRKTFSGASKSQSKVLLALYPTQYLCLLAILTIALHSLFFMASAGP
ncbi:uncharacterized protein NECHADRAFT_88852 [Fusarium vanettenii 77-13-4]|uniref:Uncharacterized protein n=1 Tax=Fusarium vanettenii (strain ATCC MYA-4622 / CBS 123669 / FGSC 9596 / NRRL 45880 / 77-13-4) TaxID=660122 RepID=C7ZN36_FUSV7|nr:uncharacterized protein NECHADRAFT_88852 [Fusarium vanettenii 77-13-4]EEU34553.1 predicted protein [Fusarium vanettenii 77-13-4]